MTAKEAYKKLISKVITGRVVKCHEYDTMFVFQLMPKALLLSNTKSTPLDALMSVDKNTGEVMDFKPFYISLDEYERGVEIPESEYAR